MGGTGKKTALCDHLGSFHLLATVCNSMMSPSSIALKPTVRSLKEWFSTFSHPEEIESDKGSYFTAVVVQGWAKKEGSSGYSILYVILRPIA